MLIDPATVCRRKTASEQFFFVSSLLCVCVCLNFFLSNCNVIFNLIPRFVCPGRSICTHFCLVFSTSVSVHRHIFSWAAEGFDCFFNSLPSNLMSKSCYLVLLFNLNASSWAPRLLQNTVQFRQLKHHYFWHNRKSLIFSTSQIIAALIWTFIIAKHFLYFTSFLSSVSNIIIMSPFPQIWEKSVQ